MAFAAFIDAVLCFFLFLSSFKNVDISFVWKLFNFCGVREFIIDFNACSAYSKYCEYYTLPALFTSQWREKGEKTTTLNWDILLSLATMPLNDEWLWDNFLFFRFIALACRAICWPDIVARDTVPVFMNFAEWFQFNRKRSWIEKKTHFFLLYMLNVFLKKSFA